MKISILSVFPDLYDSFLKTSLLKRAQDTGLVSIAADSFFSYVEPKERIDAPTFGHGAGMLIKPEVVERGIQANEQKYGKAFKIFFSPHGKKLDQDYLVHLVGEAQEVGHMMLVPARYEGMDARVEAEYADAIVSVGDFVLMGGDVPAMILLEGLLRLIPGVVGKQESIEKESFTGPFVDYPEYTEPVVWHDKEVPEVVRSGNHAAMDNWRMEQAARRTLANHFDWLRSFPLNVEQKKLVRQVLPSHYVALCHSDVLVGQEKQPGTTSVTSIDIHDIARSSRTYGVKNFFIVTPLLDQQRIVQTLLDFWHTESGITYNKSRHEALKPVELKDTIQQVVAAIEQLEGKKPLVVATSARAVGHVRQISFHDQGVLWQQERPILFVFGTGKGFSEEFLQGCDYLLLPVGGFSDFNHLSVRSAVAIILDRWMGIVSKKA